VSKPVIVAAKISQKFEDALCASGHTLHFDYQNLELRKNAVGIITSTKLIIDKPFLDECNSLKWICRLGSGMEIIDVEYATQKNVQCFSSAAGIAPAVAEFVVGSLIALQRNIFSSAHQVRNYQWIREANRTFELKDKVLGIIGYGNTGSRTAELLKPFCKEILAYDLYLNSTTHAPLVSSLDVIYEQADIVSYHVPLNAHTSNYYRADKFAKPHILINSSRGAVASTNEILNGFESGKLIGACLDVLDFETELNETSVVHPQLEKLLLHNCLITPHIAGYSHNAIERMSDELLNCLKQSALLTHVI
jgi:D-3-phosphoglycerate dehydrogenase / 2-oxoglutarate reductase